MSSICLANSVVGFLVVALNGFCLTDVVYRLASVLHTYGNINSMIFKYKFSVSVILSDALDR